MASLSKCPAGLSHASTKKERRSLLRLPRKCLALFQRRPGMSNARPAPVQAHGSKAQSLHIAPVDPLPLGEQAAKAALFGAVLSESFGLKGPGALHPMSQRPSTVPKPLPSKGLPWQSFVLHALPSTCNLQRKWRPRLCNACSTNNPIAQRHDTCQAVHARKTCCW